MDVGRIVGEGVPVRDARSLFGLGLVLLVGCFDSFAIDTDAGRDAGPRDGSRDFGLRDFGTDFGTDFGRPDGGPPDFGVDAGDGGVEIFADGSVVIAPRPPVPDLYEACNAIEVLHCLGTHLCCEDDPSGVYGDDASFCEAERLGRDGVGVDCEIYRDPRASDGTIAYDEMAAIAFWEEMRDRLRVCASSPLGRFPAGRLDFLEGTLPVGAVCTGGDPAANHLACERRLRCPESAGVCAQRASSGDLCDSNLDCGSGLFCNTANPGGRPRCDAELVVGRTRSWCIREDAEP